MKSSNHVAQTAACSAFILALVASTSNLASAQTNTSCRIEKTQTVPKNK